MSGSPQMLVMDSGPLGHFAKAGWLKILEVVAGDRPVVMPDAVRAELVQGCHSYPHLSQVLDAPWIQVDRSDDVELLMVTTRYENRLVDANGRNRGERGVLALAEVRRGIAVVDDRVAREVGREHKVEISGTLALLCQAIREGLLTVPLVEKIADDLLETKYRLPYRPGQFRSWAAQVGLI